jgi:hypothetical protein
MLEWEIQHTLKTQNGGLAFAPSHRLDDFLAGATFLRKIQLDWVSATGLQLIFRTRTGRGPFPKEQISSRRASNSSWAASQRITPLQRLPSGVFPSQTNTKPSMQTPPKPKNPGFSSKLIRADSGY